VLSEEKKTRKKPGRTLILEYFLRFCCTFLLVAYSTEASKQENYIEERKKKEKKRCATYY